MDLKLFFGPKNFLEHKNPELFWTQNFFQIFLEPKSFLDPKIFFRTQKLSSTQKPRFFWTQKFFRPKFFFHPKRSSLVLWYKPTKPKSFEQKTFQDEHFRPKSCFLARKMLIFFILGVDFGVFHFLRYFLWLP